jgi:hypothetical protein
MRLLSRVAFQRYVTVDSIGLPTDTILFGIAILLVWVSTQLPTNPESGLIGVFGGAIALLGYLGAIYSRLTGSD